jgi:Zn-finger nucleic acid-binding protein
MSACSSCGAPVTFAGGAPALCTFCGTTTEPPPKEVQVPVPVQVVHNVVHLQGGTEAEARGHELRCPHCRRRLVSVRAGQVELAGCGSCGGIWIDNDSARRVLASPDDVVGKLADRAGTNAPNPPRRQTSPACPRCAEVLDRLASHGIDLDVCVAHGTWFDAFELGRLTDLLLGRGRTSPRRADGTVTCVKCAAVLRGDGGNLTPDGIMCEACWRADQQKRLRSFDQEPRNAELAFAAAALLMVGGAAAAASRDR